MDDLSLVRGVQRIDNMPGNRQRLLDGKRPARDPLGEIFAFDQLHHDGSIDDAVDLGDVGVIERRQYLRFTLETSQPLGVSFQRLRQNLQGDVALEDEVFGPIHLAHRTGPDGRGDLVRADLRSRRETHSWQAGLYGSGREGSSRVRTPGGVKRDTVILRFRLTGTERAQQ